MIRYDHVIVGAGSSGCVLAARLSEDPQRKVLVLEAGPPDRFLWIHIPIGYGKTMWDKRVNWCFETDPDPGMDGRRIYWPRGKTLGGSSSINGLIYIRGQREDYDNWAALGNRGWGFDDVLPLFIRSETNQRGVGPFHGERGSLHVSDIGEQHELIEAFIAGAGEIGVPRNDDFNGATQEGAGYYQLTTHRGLRCSTASGFLKPIRSRPNLRVECHAQATSLVLEGNRVTGVRYRQFGQDHVAHCDGEVVLSAGALQSPQLLQLSGIGSPELLERVGIPVRHALPGVGDNLQDHLQFRLIHACTQPITTNDTLNSWFGRARIGLQWLLKRSGPLAVGINQGGCFMRALPQESDRPDIQFHMGTLSADMAGGRPHPFPGFTLSVCQLRPTSRGRVQIRSDNPFESPSIQPNYLSTDLDRRTAVAALRAARAIAASPSMRPYVKQELTPGLQATSDEELLAFCRANGATIFHPVGTCRMGTEPDAVVDEALRVHGLEGLRVADCSIMPTLVSGNTNAAAIMIAEKAAQMMI